MRGHNSELPQHISENGSRLKSPPTAASSGGGKNKSANRDQTILTEAGSEPRPPRNTRSTRLSRSFDDPAYTPVRNGSTSQNSNGKKPNRSLEHINGVRRKVRICYNDGGPGPDEAKTVLPEPRRNN